MLTKKVIKLLFTSYADSKIDILHKLTEQEIQSVFPNDEVD
mgnify:CR=1 FL=1